MKKLFAVLMLFTIAILAGCLTSSDDGDGSSKEVWQVYGYVNKADGSGIKDVSMKLAKGGTTIATTTTIGYGYYSFNDIPSGTYTVIPSKSGYTFSPAEVRNVVVNGDFGSLVVVQTIVGTYSY